MILPLAGILDVIGDVPIAIALAAGILVFMLFFGLMALNRWVTGAALNTALGLSLVLTLVGNLVEGVGGQMGLSVGSSALLFLLGAVVMTLVKSKPSWRTLQTGMLFVGSAITAAIVYASLSLLFADVKSRIDESVLLTIAPGFLLIFIATATRKTLGKTTRLMSAVGLVVLLASAPLLFMVEWGVVITAIGFSIASAGLAHEALN